MLRKAPAAALRRAAPPLWIGLLACTAPALAAAPDDPAEVPPPSAAVSEGESASRTKVYQAGYFTAFSPTSARATLPRFIRCAVVLPKPSN